MEIVTQLIKAALRLPNKGIIKIHKKYSVAKEIPNKGSLHQVKYVLDVDRREQYQFYLQNMALMAKTEDMSAKNYNRLRHDGEFDGSGEMGVQKKVQELGATSSLGSTYGIINGKEGWEMLGGGM